MMPYKDKNKIKEYASTYYQNNKEKHNSRCLKWRKENKEKTKVYDKQRRERKRIWLQEIKTKLFCVVCGENHIACLDFHHRDPNEKEQSIGRMIRTHSKQRILDEIAKCDVLCSNCHRKHHYEESNSKI